MSEQIGTTCTCRSPEWGKQLGEARKRALRREKLSQFCVPMHRARFNLLAIGTRYSNIQLIAEELSWWSSPDEKLIAMAARDKIDNDFSWVILARDAIGRFRCVKVWTSYTSLSRAEDAMFDVMVDTIQTQDLIELGKQGDETNLPIDLLRLPIDCDPETLHPYFRVLLENPGREPARAVIREIGPWLTPNDPHLVGEFQNKGFDQRLWEIYLWAVFREFGLDVKQLEAPDFLCKGPGVEFCVEATTAAPSAMGPLAEHPNPQNFKEMEEFLSDYMPMKFGSALKTKLDKKNKNGQHYWEREESAKKPFLIAIADFHKPVNKNEIGSMTYTQSALYQYLYGHRMRWKYEGDQLVITPQKIDAHKFGAKEIPSGFFDQPNAENVSAVIFSNAGTLAKFDRMGVVAGVRPKGFSYARVGLKQNSDPNAVHGAAFSIDVSDPSYQEYWTDEVQVLHNPNAKLKLPFHWLLGAVHHYFEDGEFRSFGPEGAILNSYTMIMHHK